MVTKFKSSNKFYSHTTMTQSQDFRDRAKADAKLMKPSQAKADGRGGKAKARQAEKLPGSGLEPR